MNKIIQIEGARNCGKTFLTNKLIEEVGEEFGEVYKFPFVDFYDNLFMKMNNCLPNNPHKMDYNNKPELYYFTLGYDIMLLDLAKKGLLKGNIIVDRGWLSNIVFGVQSGRIDFETGIIVAKWLDKNYSDILVTLYVSGDSKIEDKTRNKDAWSIYQSDKSRTIYNNLFSEMKKSKIVRFENKFDEASIDKYIDIISEI